jgi:NADPH-dependent 2,4-dienoyl-CoA reductase/sulfur reductase-like enzyme
MEQGQTLSAAASLGGRPVAPVRISFAEARERHRVVSHHSLSALRYGALARCTVAVPRLPGGREAEVLERLAGAGITDRHDVRVVDAGETLEALDHFGLKPMTMGRSVADDPAFHLAAGAAGVVASEGVHT